MVQMIAGFSSLINGGNYYQPHVVKQILNANGGVVENIDDTLIKQTVTAKTSDYIRHAMWRTVEEGTGKTAKVPGYQIGGKTGTAQHLDKTEESYHLWALHRITSHSCCVMSLWMHLRYQIREAAVMPAGYSVPLWGKHCRI